MHFNRAGSGNNLAGTEMATGICSFHNILKKIKAVHENKRARKYDDVSLKHRNSTIPEIMLVHVDAKCDH